VLSFNISLKRGHKVRRIVASKNITLQACMQQYNRAYREQLRDSSHREQLRDYCVYNPLLLKILWTLEFSYSKTCSEVRRRY